MSEKTRLHQVAALTLLLAGCSGPTPAETPPPPHTASSYHYNPALEIFNDGWRTRIYRICDLGRAVYIVPGGDMRIVERASECSEPTP